MSPPALPLTGGDVTRNLALVHAMEFANTLHRAPVPERMDPIPALNTRGGRDVPPQGWRTVYSVVVAPDMCNPHGELHAGAAATLIWSMTSASLALLATEGFWGSPMISGVSAALGMSYFHACPVGTKVRLTVTVDHVGPSLANVRAELSDWDTGRRFAAGKHVKAWRDVREKAKM